MGSAASSTSASASASARFCSRSSSSLGGSFSGKKATIAPDGVLVDDLNVYKEFIKENEDNEEYVDVILYTTEIIGYSGVSDFIYHQLLYLEKYNGESIIIEWTSSGLCITDWMNTSISRSEKGRAKIADIIKAAKRHSKEKFQLITNNCRKWCKNVLKDLNLGYD